jgi:Mycothiol maleylpyruvate isomerase N-terminal domain
VKQQIDDDRLPEWQPFLDAVQQRRPDAGSWCEAWTVRDIVIHQAGNAEELARVLGAHLAGEPVATRGFAEREASLRAMNETDLWAALHRNMATLNEVAEATDDVPADAEDVVVGADANRTTIRLADPDGPVTLETDAATRVLLLWGRRPADPSRICSRVGPETLGRVRSLLAGY